MYSCIKGLQWYGGKIEVIDDGKIIIVWEPESGELGDSSAVSPSHKTAKTWHFLFGKNGLWQFVSKLLEIQNVYLSVCFEIKLSLHYEQALPTLEGSSLSNAS